MLFYKLLIHLLFLKRSDGGIGSHRKFKKENIDPQRDTRHIENVKQSNIGIKNSGGN